MAKFKRKDYGTWDVWRKSYSPDELDARYRELARATNSRIRRLRQETSLYGADKEPLWSRPFYAGIKTRLGERVYFTEVKHPKLNHYDLLNDITAMEEFLATKSSTVGGIRELERNRSNKFIEKGVPSEIAKDPRFYDFLSSKTFSELDLYHVPSKKIIELISEYSNDLSMDDIVNAFQEYLNADSSKHDYLNLRKVLNKNRRAKRKASRR